MRPGFFNRYPDLWQLQQRAKKRIPSFAFEYLEGGCNENENMQRNMSDFKQIQLMPQYLQDFKASDPSVTIFGEKYDAPFGVTAIGLQGLIWPNSAEILARAAAKGNIPFMLSTVTTSSIERIAEITGGKAWFQLYYPQDAKVRDDIIRRLKDCGIKNLCLLSDVPTFGYRGWDIRNGLSMRPKMSLKNFLQISGKPRWALNTLRHGQPSFASLKPYTPKGLNLTQLGEFMNKTFDGRLSERKIVEVREQWEGNLIIKGIVNPKDVEVALKLGIDGIIVSNHGGRQLDAGESSIKPLRSLAREFGDKLTVMMDGGVRSGPDMARAVACGAKMVFMGRPFMYSVGALGEKGGDHSVDMFKIQFQQVMEQTGCQSVADLPSRLVE